MSEDTLPAPAGPMTRTATFGMSSGTPLVEKANRIDSEISGYSEGQYLNTIYLLARQLDPP